MSKGKEKATKAAQPTTATTVDQKGAPISEDEAKEKGSKGKSSYDNIPPLPPQNKGKGSTQSKGKGKGNYIVYYFCGRPGHIENAISSFHLDNTSEPAT
eukprot:6226820-Amphidinium_carterae.2